MATYTGTSAANTYAGTQDADAISGEGGNDTLSGAGGNDEIIGGSGLDQLNGGEGDDTLAGGSFDTNGGYVDTEADVLTGGNGNDFYFIANGGDTIVETTTGGTDTIVLVGNGLLDVTLQANIENFQTGAAVASELVANLSTAALNVTGNDLSNRIWGTGGDNVLAGGAGNDTLNAANGNDDLTGGTGSDSLNGGAGSDTLYGGDFDAAYNYVDTEADTLNGGAGDDFYFIANNVDTIQEAAGGGTDTQVLVGNAVNVVSLQANVENFQTGTVAATEFVANLSTLDLEVYGNDAANRIWGTGGNNYIEGGSGNDTINGANGQDDLIGGAGSDSLVGGAGNDTLSGGTYDAQFNYIDTEADTLNGGAGFDTYVLTGTLDTIVEAANGGTDTVILWNSAITDFTLQAQLENFQVQTFVGTESLANQTTHNLNVTGNELNNRIWGNGGNNILIGASGNDTLLAANGQDELYGGAGSDSLNGGQGSDILYGGDFDADGNAIDTELDTLNGGAGDDFLVVHDNTDTIIETATGGNDTLVLMGTATNIQLVDNVENFQTNYVTQNDFLANVSKVNVNVTGNAGNNRIWGTGGANKLVGGDGKDTLLGADGVDTLEGGSGDDVLNGGTGADRLDGGKGNDTYHIDSTSDVIIEAEKDAEGSSNGAADTIISSVGFSLTDAGTHAGVEHLTLTGTAALGAGNRLNNILTGNQANNNLSGAGGDDTIDGGAGADAMAGGTGDDVLVVDNVGDVVTEFFNQGTDTVQTGLNNYQLGANVERLVLTGTTGLRGLGNDLDNGLKGTSGADTLVGLGGVDLLEGGQGNDVLHGDDTVASGAFGDDILLGQEGDDTLWGGAGNDTLDGGVGADVLNGGLGDDTYYLGQGDQISESGGGGIDTVYTTLVSYQLGADLENLELAETADDMRIASGNSAANQITGSSVSDIIRGQGGNDTLYGGWGDDSYYFGSNDGQDIIFDAGSDLAGDDAVFSTLDYRQLWFSKAANGSDLEISVIGTANKVTVSNWYDGADYQLEAIYAKNGTATTFASLDHGKVDALVSAMAAMVPPAAGQTTLTAQQQQQLNPTFAATWVA